MGTPKSRSEVSDWLMEIAEHHIVAEWVCCEPLDPKHGLCAEGYAALGMVRTLLVDSPEAGNPAAPLLDAVLDLLSADRATLEVEQPVETQDGAVNRVTDLYGRWVKAGPPPLGTSMSRWWDKRLAELHAAILPAERQPDTQTQEAS